MAELYRAAGHPERATGPRTAALLERYLTFLGGALADRVGRVTALPGVVALLERLAGERDVVVGLLTGNVLSGAQLKLEAAGLPFQQFALGAFGSDSGHRPDLPAIAVERARAQFGRTPVGEEVIIVGDTPADVSCGASLGVRTIAVATGSYSLDDLQATGADAVFPTLDATADVVDAMLAASTR